MLCGLASDVADQEVVDNQAKPDRQRAVQEEAGRVLAFAVTACSKSLDERLVGNATSLLESVHTAGDLNVDVAFVIHKVMQVVLIHDAVRNYY